MSLLTGHKVINDKAESSPGAVRRQIPLGLVAGVLVLLAAAGGVAAFFLMRDPVSQARKMARAGDKLGAVSVLKKYADSAPNDGDAFATLGKLYLDTQQYPDAASALETAVRLAPEDEDLAFLAVIAAGKLEGEGGMQRQIAALEALVQHHPDNAQAVKMLALAQGASGNLEPSKGTLGKLAAIGQSPEEVAKYQGIVDALAGDLPSARSTLAGAGDGDPDVRAALGYVSSLEGDAFGAADALSAVVTGGQDADPEAKTRLGLLYMAQGQFAQALPLLRPATGGGPSDSARFFYALCLQTSGMADEALQDFEKLVAGGGKFAEDAAVQMAMVYLQRGQIDQAAEATRKARKFGSSARLHTLEGSIAALQGAESDAQDQFRTAIQADAEYPAAHLEQGLMYVRRGVLDEGIRELELYMTLADPAIPGGRINEVDLLIKQLKQTEGGMATEAPAAASAARRALPEAAPAVEAAVETAPAPESEAEAAPESDTPLVETPVVVETPVAVETPAVAPTS